MGMYTSAWLAYGAPVKDHIDGEEFDGKLGKYDVEHLSAGHYDHGVLYFTTYAEDADLGRPVSIPADALHPAQCTHWDAKIRSAAKACGVELAGAPGWLLIADVS
jgi:hypothetical protein